MGVYLSPWDQNHPTYTPEYNKIFANTLTESFNKLWSHL